MAESGEAITFGAVEARANKLAHLWRAHGLRPGDHVAILLENHLSYLEVICAALRSGLIVTPISQHLTPREVGHILGHCDAKALVTSSTVASRLDGLALDGLAHRAMIGERRDGFDDYEQTLAAFPSTPIADEEDGLFLMYSSGSTGVPKGILEKRRFDDEGRPRPDFDVDAFRRWFGFGEGMVTLVPGPMYHAAGLGFALTTHRAGGTVILMEWFDPLQALVALEQHRVTHSVWVPTMFVWLLKLSDAERAKFDLRAHRMAMHIAAPCPPSVKRAMLDWWGPIILEAYGGTEGNGACLIDSDDWLRHPGSVGRPVDGTLHIVDDDGNEVPPGTVGTVYFSGDDTFTYWKDPAATAAARLPDGRTTLGDLGYVDDDGYLYLTDRKAALIISGGINIYPREIEDALIMHPAVADVAALGIPDDDMGEVVMAVVQPHTSMAPGPELERALRQHANEQLAGFKRPRNYQFAADLPRLPTGKLARGEIKRRYGGCTQGAAECRGG